MNARRKTIAAVFLFTVAACAVFGFWNQKNTKEEGLSQEKLQPSSPWRPINGEELQESSLVDESFASVLPLVVIETKSEKAQAEALLDEAEAEPYINIKLSLIDHKDKINLLGEPPVKLVFGKLKEVEKVQVSLNSPKKQWVLRLQIEEGQPFPMKILGMSKSDVWLLNGFQTDESYLRDYIYLDAASQLSPNVQEMRFCEVILYQDQEYEYMGLYGMYQITENGQSKDQQMLKDIKSIEECLYSNQDSKFLEYRDLLDVDSFVDYFIINEFFSNYAHEWNSSCLYKGRDGKIHIRLTGGIDSFMDHEAGEAVEILGMGLPAFLWFDRLITDEYFVEKTVKRYQELRKTVLNQEILDEKLEHAAARIQEAVSRDRKRWPGLYHKEAMEPKEDQDTGSLINHNRDTWEEEVQRGKDRIRLHGNYLDEHITSLYDFVQTRNYQRPKLFLAICFVTSFFASVILVQRVRNKSS